MAFNIFSPITDDEDEKARLYGLGRPDLAANWNAATSGGGYLGQSDLERIQSFGSLEDYLKASMVGDPGVDQSIAAGRASSFVGPTVANAPVADLPTASFGAPDPFTAPPRSATIEEPLVDLTSGYTPADSSNFGSGFDDSGWAGLSDTADMGGNNDLDVGDTNIGDDSGTGNNVETSNLFDPNLLNSFATSRPDLAANWEAAASGGGYLGQSDADYISSFSNFDDYLKAVIPTDWSIPQNADPSVVGSGATTIPINSDPSVVGSSGYDPLTGLKYPLEDPFSDDEADIIDANITNRPPGSGQGPGMIPLPINWPTAVVLTGLLNPQGIDLANLGGGTPEQIAAGVGAAASNLPGTVNEIAKTTAEGNMIRIGDPVDTGSHNPSGMGPTAPVPMGPTAPGQTDPNHPPAVFGIPISSPNQPTPSNPVVAQDGAGKTPDPFIAPVDPVTNPPPPVIAQDVASQTPSPTIAPVDPITNPPPPIIAQDGPPRAPKPDPFITPVPELQNPAPPPPEQPKPPTPVVPTPPPIAPPPIAPPPEQPKPPTPVIPPPVAPPPEQPKPPTPVVPTPPPEQPKPPTPVVPTPPPEQPTPPTPVVPTPTPTPPERPTPPTPVVPTPPSEQPTPPTPVVPTPVPTTPTTPTTPGIIVTPSSTMPTPTTIAAPMDRDYYREGNLSSEALAKLTKSISDVYGDASGQYATADKDNLAAALGFIKSQNTGLTTDAASQTAKANELLRKGNFADVDRYGKTAADQLKDLNPLMQQGLAQAAAVGPIGVSSYQDDLANMFKTGVSATQTSYTPDQLLAFSRNQAMTSGNNAVGNQLSQMAQEQLALGGSLSAEDERAAQQAAREAWAARGLVNSKGAVGSEVLNRDTLSRQRLAERQQFASGVNQQLQSQQGINNQYGTSVLGAANQSGQLGLQSGIANQTADLQALAQRLGIGTSLTSTDYNRQQMNAGNTFQNAQLQAANKFDPFATILGSQYGQQTNNTGSNQQLLSNAGALSSGALGNQYVANAFNPYNTYSNDVYGSNFNAANARNISDANNTAAMQGANTAANAQMASNFLNTLFNVGKSSKWW